ncbi:hypothetical protein GOV06_04825 [Candidatus Woesearchaeota archaeon]|nr:hypothetical protein [Candidatus Woesearchaeota archaeon]
MAEAIETQEIPKYDGMEAIVTYKCKACSAEVSSENALQHNRLPSPEEVTFDFPENLVLRYDIEGGYFIIKEKTKDIKKNNHDTLYQLSIAFLSLPHPDYRNWGDLESLGIKHGLEDGMFKLLTPEEFEEFKKECSKKLCINQREIDRFVRTTPELEERLAQEANK